MRGDPVVVVGGGASGTLAALALRRADRPVLLVSDTDPGPGLAYRTPELYHLLNSRAATLSAHPHNPHHFTHWLSTPASSGPAVFAARRRYGAYLADTLARTATAGGLDHQPGRAIAVHPAPNGAQVDLATGLSLRAAAVVLATGHTAPRVPPPAAPIAAHHRYVNDPWSPGALAATAYAGPVLLIGTGLTAIDVAMTIHRHNPDAPLHAISRHGLLPTRHPDTDAAPPWPTDVVSPCQPGGAAQWPATVRELLALVRRSLAEAAAAGSDWRCVVDGLRLRADPLWEGLSVAERHRFVRHVDRFWQVCRHRMAPPVGRAVDTMLDAGTLRPAAARLLALAPTATGIRAELRTRAGADLTLHCGTVVNCTGPGSPATGADPLAESLRRSRLARLNPLATGFDCDPTGALLDATGRPSGHLWAVGPIRRGSTWETTAIPEIRSQAATLAAALATPATTALRQPTRPAAIPA